MIINTPIKIDSPQELDEAIANGKISKKQEGQISKWDRFLLEKRAIYLKLEEDEIKFVTIKWTMKNYDRYFYDHFEIFNDPAIEKILMPITKTKEGNKTVETRTMPNHFVPHSAWDYLLKEKKVTY